MKSILPQNSLGDSNYAPWGLGNSYFKVCSTILSKAYNGIMEIIRNFLLSQKLNFKLLHNGNYAFLPFIVTA